ncbi:MAG TPA: 4a-hydroxytetrahydrobiopterin dehydratase [Nocardioidaceae bacterium]|nr:4a-hydroxytetrahydrobiopterin dehydratase [Nocardioidaceae bacterium]
MVDVLDSQQIHAVLAEHPHWEHRDGALVRVLQAPDFMSGIRLVTDVAEVAEELNHHPDIDIRWTTITFRLSTHSEGGVTSNDVELAGRIDGIADRLDH